MKSSKEILFEHAADFFSREGSVWMRLAPAAAIEVCMTAAAHGKVVARIEGGMWHGPGFEARHDCIWDGVDPPVSLSDAHLNNLSAVDFVRDEMEYHTVFIMTAPPMSGWPHKVNDSPS